VGYINSTVNPFIYGIFCREFRGTILHDVGRFKEKMACCKK
jgi:hypothetical protein